MKKFQNANCWRKLWGRSHWRSWKNSTVSIETRPTGHKDALLSLQRQVNRNLVILRWLRSADLAICVSMPWWLSMSVAISGSTQTYNCFPLCRVFKTSQAPLLLCSPSTNFSLQIRLFEVSVFWADVVRLEVMYWHKNNYCRFSMFFFWAKKFQVIL